MSSNKPKIIKGAVAKDERGQLSFINDFDMAKVKRFYMVENANLDLVRAWHGHALEEKYVFVLSGKALVAAVQLDNLVAPSKENEIHKHILSSGEHGVFHIPGGYANGFKALEPGTKVVFFSTSTLEESKNDDFRFPIDYFGMEVWKE